MIVLRSGGAKTGRFDPFSSLSSWSFTAEAELEAFIRVRIGSFRGGLSMGCIQLVMSVIMTKTVAV